MKAICDYCIKEPSKMTIRESGKQCCKKCFKSMAEEGIRKSGGY